MPACRLASRARSGSTSSKARTSLSIVVDSPPGMISASTASSSDGAAHGGAAGTRLLHGIQVLPHVALDGEDTNGGNRTHGASVGPRPVKDPVGPRPRDPSP